MRIRNPGAHFRPKAEGEFKLRIPGTDPFWAQSDRPDTQPFRLHEERVGRARERRGEQSTGDKLASAQSDCFHEIPVKKWRLRIGPGSQNIGLSRNDK